MEEQAAQAAGMGIMLVGLVLLLVIVVSMWVIFSKAGKPGWAAIVPIYNLVVLCQIAGRPAWWVLLYLVPVVSFIISIIVTVGLAKNFGKGAGYVVGLIFLPFIFFPMLAFGDAKYQG